ncbi:MAG: hypothetical protein Q4E75_01570 [bacterium]|nr:hypothetical protein [bacterium]
MVYNESFKKRVLEYLPNQLDIQKMLDDGNAFLGRVLYDCCSSMIEPEEVVNAFEGPEGQSQKAIMDLYNKAKRLSGLKGLYAKWVALKQAQTKKTQESSSKTF